MVCDSVWPCTSETSASMHPQMFLIAANGLIKTSRRSESWATAACESHAVLDVLVDVSVDVSVHVHVDVHVHIHLNVDVHVHVDVS